MIVIDTNVISEMMRSDPDPGVLRWTTEAGRLHTTSITMAEVEYGIARLPEGRRKAGLTATARRLFDNFRDVILSFDGAAAYRYGELVADCERTGRPITMADAQIAAICLSRDAALATRNTADFVATGAMLLNPWSAADQGD